ncbi:hypothetical protein ABGB12_05995 [Actinocorallia sp. B10E7]|uniref:hypothetical protein n=1 Tax=Actinocorallia sp. B10E7 TaxID=3153558 RepID=UPI00325D6DC5
MSVDDIGPALGVLGMLVGLVLFVTTLRRGPFLPPYVPEQLCADCGHPRAEHSSGVGRCFYELGDPHDGNSPRPESQRRAGPGPRLRRRPQGSATVPLRAAGFSG